MCGIGQFHRDSHERGTMPVIVKKVPPTFKHGGYCASDVLPGESAAAFEKLKKDIVDELAPNGPLEDDIVKTLARLVWRKQNLGTFNVAQRARERASQLLHQQLARHPSPLQFGDPFELDQATRDQAVQDGEKEARKELGQDYALVEVGESATMEGLMADLAVRDRLDAMIDRCLKRLLFLRGLKSISGASHSGEPKKLSHS
jgi:hypothetical protein